MPASKRLLSVAFVCLASFSSAQVTDEIAAARILGPRWKQVSRSAGMIFSGTVLGVEALPTRKDRPVPMIELKFRVDRAIAGVRPGQVLTLHEWTGASSTQRAFRAGNRMLLFFYSPSRLGLTSPVGGAVGQIALDLRGELFAERTFPAPRAFGNAPAPVRTVLAPQPITLLQLERAIRKIRKDRK